MGMGIVSDTEFDKQRNNLIPNQIQQDITTPHSHTDSCIDPVNNPESRTPIPLNKVPSNQSDEPREVIGTVMELVGPGRNKGDVEVPESLRALISSTSITDGRAAAISLARQFGLSESSVSAYLKGATSTASYDTPDAILKEKNDKVRSSVTKRARKRLMLAINEITEDKLKSAKLRDISGVARDMSQIIKNMNEDTNDKDKSNKPQFVVFAPIINEESKYKTIEVRE